MYITKKELINMLDEHNINEMEVDINIMMTRPEVSINPINRRAVEECIEVKDLLTIEIKAFINQVSSFAIKTNSCQLNILK